VILCGPSAVGKGTLAKMLMQRHPAVFQWGCSHTTRKPREGEVNGVDYWFVSVEEFTKLWDEKGFIERNNYNGNWYGVSYGAMKLIRDNNRICLLDIDIYGVKSFKTAGVEGRYIFILPPEPRMDTLRSRLVGRGTEDPVTVENRINKAIFELQFYQDNTSLWTRNLINDNKERSIVELEEWLGLPKAQ